MPQPLSERPSILDITVSKMLRCARIIEDEQARSLVSYRISGPQVAILQVLARNGDGGGMTQVQLSHELCVSKPNITGLVQRLERAGLVTRKQGRDARSKLVGLSMKGADLLGRVSETLNEVHRRLLKPLRRDEIRLLADMIDEVSNGSLRDGKRR